MNTPILAVDNVEKSFATVHAVRGVSFEVRPGEIFALLGPNGAGKTTLTRMILGIIRPDRGRIRFCFDGRETDRPQRAQTGYLPEDRGLFRDLPILRTLVYFAQLRGLSATEARARALDWLDRFDLKDRADERLDALSRGNQQKVQFISSILHEPPLAVLDEPFSGFDPVNQQLLLDLMQDLRSRGMTVLLSAHHMELVEKIADRVLLISAGQTVLYGTLDELRRNDDAEMRLEIEYDGECDLASLRNHKGIAAAEQLDAGRLLLLGRSSVGLSDVLAVLGSAVRVRSIHGGRQTLHDIYVRAVGNDPEAGEPEASGTSEESQG